MKTTTPETITMQLNGKRSRTPIVEFVGPPGVGKSTNCNCFAEKLQAKGISICRSEDLKAYYRELNGLKKFQLYTSTLLLHALTLLQFTAVLAKHRIFSFNSVYRLLRLSVFQQALRRLINQKAIDLVLLDQWMIQELWSATIFKTDNTLPLQSELRKFYFKTDYLFYFDLDLEKAAARIANRTHGRSRFDQMTPEKRLAEMKKYTSYLHQLFQHADCCEKHTLSTEHSPDQNSELFLKLLAPVLPNHP